MEEHVVAEGSYQGGLAWRLIASRGAGGELGTMITVTDPAGRILSSGGSGGPPLRPGRLLNVSSGGADEGPYRVDVRVPPHVSAVTVTTSAGEVLAMPLYDCDAVPEVRFGLVLVPRDLRLADVRAFAQDGRELDRFDLGFHQDFWHRSRERESRG